jgi:hypothetical protein
MATESLAGRARDLPHGLEIGQGRRPKRSWREERRQAPSSLHMKLPRWHKVPLCGRVEVVDSFLDVPMKAARAKFTFLWGT